MSTLRILAEAQGADHADVLAVAREQGDLDAAAAVLSSGLLVDRAALAWLLGHPDATTDHRATVVGAVRDAGLGAEAVAEVLQGAGVGAARSLLALASRGSRVGEVPSPVVLDVLAEGVGAVLRGAHEDLAEWLVLAERVAGRRMRHAPDGSSRVSAARRRTWVPGQPLAPEEVVGLLDVLTNPAVDDTVLDRVYEMVTRSARGDLDPAVDLAVVLADQAVSDGTLAALAAREQRSSGKGGRGGRGWVVPAAVRAGRVAWLTCPLVAEHAGDPAVQAWVVECCTGLTRRQLGTLARLEQEGWTSSYLALVQTARQLGASDG